MNNSNSTCVINAIDFGNLSLWQANRVIRGAGEAETIVLSNKKFGTWARHTVTGFNLPQLHQICEHYQFRDSTQCIQLGQILDATDGFYKFQLQERPWHSDADKLAEMPAAEFKKMWGDL
jgi:hypothetical protein